MCQPYSDCACTQTSLHMCDLRMPYDWFYNDTTQNGWSRDKCVLAHFVATKYVCRYMHPGDTKMCQYSLCSSDSACSQTSLKTYVLHMT